MKQCASCRAEKRRSDFRKDRSRRDGLQPYCRACQDEKVKASREKRIEHYREVAREYGRQHVERRKMTTKQWRQQNPDRSRAIYLRWKERNLGAERLRAHARRGAATDRDYAAVIALDPCAYCKRAGGTIDHIVPLAVGGTGDFLNLTSACLSCNSSKWRRGLLEHLLAVKS